jgi:hypothetical protein
MTIKMTRATRLVHLSLVLAAVLVLCGCPPSNFFYPTPPPLLVRQAMTPLSPTVTGTVTGYSVSPALPAGISLDPHSGVISGTPVLVTARATYTVTATNSTGSTPFGLVLQVDSGPTVHLAATATSTTAAALNFQWKTSDGSLLNVNRAQADWLLPPGPGLHFAYTLVTDGKGGFTQGRIVVSTDAIGNPLASPLPGQTATAPAAPTHAVNYWRGWTESDLPHTTGPNGSPLFPTIPNVFVRMRGVAFGDKTPVVQSNSRGQFLIQGGSSTELYDVDCSFDGVNFVRCGGGTPEPIAASLPLDEGAELSVPGSLGNGGFPASNVTWGLLTLADGVTPCGGSDEFFSASLVPTATLTDQNGQAGGNTLFDNYGMFLGATPSNTLRTIRFTCGSAVTVANAPGGGDATTTIPGTSAPVISNITATFNGVSTGTFLPPTTGPSDFVPRSDTFLAFKGLDSRVSGCAYYKAIGATTDCAPDGTLIGATTFDQWKRAVGLSPYNNPGATEVQAAYVNKVDLNLTRKHHSISYGPKQTGAYVCNHLGPKNESQAEVDRVVDDALTGKNLVACVAMDSLVHPGANGDAPFVRFMIFGPDGSLLPSVNLDNRGEKFVPGACVACHGGDRYANRFPTDGTGEGNIGAHFLPYDTGNFAFSSKAGLTEVDQQASLHGLNTNVLATSPTPATQSLIQGWYASGTDVLDKNYVPTSWVQGTALDVNLYKNVIARSCRTCHVAMAPFVNFDAMGPGGIMQGPVVSIFCKPNLSHRAYQMPNSLVTFNRFWNSQGTAQDQVAIVNAWLTASNIPQACALSAPTLH